MLRVAPASLSSVRPQLVSRHWSFGLVRVETHHAYLLEPVAAACVADRQRGGDDPRGDRHLSGVRAVELLLTARQPAIFSVALCR